MADRRTTQRAPPKDWFNILRASITAGNPSATVELINKSKSEIAASVTPGKLGNLVGLARPLAG